MRMHVSTGRDGMKPHPCQELARSCHIYCEPVQCDKTAQVIFREVRQRMSRKHIILVTKDEIIYLNDLGAGKA